MKKVEKIPDFDSYKEMGEFWETHSLADYWDVTEPADFEMAPEPSRRCLVAVDQNIVSRVHKAAQSRGLTTESLVNLLLERCLQED